MELKITDINIFPVAQQDSLIGFGSCEVNDYLRISGIALHIDKVGQLRLVWPAKKVGQGYSFYSQPLSSEISEQFRIAFENKSKELGLFSFAQ